jgi:long-subunit acyl-CoA synthetase (AMP-forming)
LNRAEFFRRLSDHAAFRPGSVALADGTGTRVRWRDLPDLVAAAAAEVESATPRSLGLLAGNGVPWVLADLAALSTATPVVPLPGFFSDGQLTHALRVALPDVVATDDPDRIPRVAPGAVALGTSVAGLDLFATGARGGSGPVADRITFTSGTTGAPKGVCLRTEGMLGVASSLALALASGPADRHLALLPLAILLENLGGVWRSLLAGGGLVLPKLTLLGVKGATGADGGAILDSLEAARATTVILMPAHLRAVVDELARGRRPPPALRFAGVGGARVPPKDLLRARTAGFPAFEGYGLSEASSVVSLNLPGADRPGSVGRPLPHAKVRVSKAGEVLVRGALFAGYVGDATPPPTGEFWPTGDLGRIDDDGYLHLLGRKREFLVTAYGRNVSPAWLEERLLESGTISHAVVFGEGRAQPAAVVSCPTGPDAAGEVVRRVNGLLPDYARIATFALRADLPPAGTCAERERLGALLGKECTWVSTND